MSQVQNGGINVLPEAWPGARLVDLAAGGGHTAVGVVLDGRYGVYSWGENEWGQLGVGGFMAKHVPTRLPCDFGELPRHFSSMLAAGAENTIVMVQAIPADELECAGHVALSSIEALCRSQQR
jgi:hypothetical protein